MLDIHAVRGQLEEFYRYQEEEERARAGKLERALAAVSACGGLWERLRDSVEERTTGRLLARLVEDPSARHAAGTRPTPVTVVATDGSQIYPDRHVEPTCFLLNVSRIAFQYGTLEPPLMTSTPHLKFRGKDVAEVLGDGYAIASEEVVAALRDELELADLLETALQVRVDRRPIVAMADGTLIRWMLRGLRNRELEQRLLKGYTDALEGFKEVGIPVCSYISMPGNTEVVNTLGLYLHLFEKADDEASLDGLPDRWLFARFLNPGERSALYGSRSLIQKHYPRDERICFFYVQTGDRPGLDEVARVELPAWVADRSERIDLLHAIVLDECRKGRGYPMILTEAHEHAVIRGADRMLFYELLETMNVKGGFSTPVSMKRTAKQRPLV